MSQKKILVIDDSATIRRLVDSTLSPAGYVVVLAPNAEDGVARAAEVLPDLIILDHQLPGTTGVEVCEQLLADDLLKNIPVIASSTLRKKAYVEYADCPNVVDMLPKPYTSELLLTTVSNALDTAAMIVDSQRDGTAVPEIINPLGDVALSGTFGEFNLRAVLDFLNNCQQEGVLELEGQSQRVWIHVARGRIQAITASGWNAEELIEKLPEALRDLGPVLRLTVAGGSCTQVDGLVQLLDNKVLDPRLLQKLLRHQAAVLLMACFQTPLNTFRFETKRRPPALHDRLALDISVAALLVEGCLADPSSTPVYDTRHVFSRKAMRGQNLDRAGLSAQHQKLLGQLNSPIPLTELADSLEGEPGEIARALHAFVLADLVEVKEVRAGVKVVVLETEPQMTLKLREVAQDAECPCVLKVVRDRLSFQLLLKRQVPDVIAVAVDTEVGQQVWRDYGQQLSDVAWLALGTPGTADVSLSQAFQALERPYTIEELLEAVQSVPETCDAST